MNNQACILCDKTTVLYISPKYRQCPKCQAIQKLKQNFLSFEQELARYQKHDFNPTNLGHLNYLKPVFEYIQNHIDETKIGLDYGSGPSSIFATHLNHQMDCFDPYFLPNNKISSTKKYDFIICTEVIEHFADPKNSFFDLKQLLQPDGILLIMTQIYNPNIDFQNWWYKNDQTHKIFYQKETFEYIKEKYNFKKINIVENIITLYS